MNANQVIRRLQTYEMSSERPADGRRVIREERMKLVSTLRDGHATEIGERLNEAIRVGKMWGAL